MIDLVNEVELGSTKGTDLEEAVEKNFIGECKEVGLYLAMSRQAQRDGYPEISQALNKSPLKKQATEPILLS